MIEMTETCPYCLRPGRECLAEPCKQRVLARVEPGAPRLRCVDEEAQVFTVLPLLFAVGGVS